MKMLRTTGLKNCCTRRKHVFVYIFVTRLPSLAMHAQFGRNVCFASKKRELLKQRRPHFVRRRLLLSLCFQSRCYYLEVFRSPCVKANTDSSKPIN